MSNKLILSSSPHLRSNTTVKAIMLDVIIALLPAMIASVIIFGYRALILLCVCSAGCVLCEYISRRVMKRTQTVGDLSAIVTGILLAMNLPVSISPLIALFGCIVAIVVVKQMFGGIGQNFVNPALCARIVLLTSFPSKMTTWTVPFAYLSPSPDAIASATPLSADANYSYKQLLLGTTGGCLGETCALAIIIGGVYLIVRRVISPVIPLCYLGSAALLSFALGEDPLYQLLSGGIMLGAVFMATDYTTSPINTKGKVIYAIGCGVITVLIRVYGSLPEGTSFAIILMNILVPHIEALTLSKPFGSRFRKIADTK